MLIKICELFKISAYTYFLQQKCKINKETSPIKKMINFFKNKNLQKIILKRKL